MSDSTGSGADPSAERTARGGSPDRDDSAPRGDGRGQDATSRRRLLAASGGAAAALLAGCSSLLPEGDEPAISGDSFGDGGSGGNGTNETETPSPTPEPETETDVVGLVLGEGDAEREFSVTLETTGTGADWWQLETLGGERILRESFDEPRSGRFTTSRTANPDATKVLVRGHDAVLGYGGQVILVDLEEGNPVAEKQGDEPESFENYEF